MKIFISADIEGVTGCTTWTETLKDKTDYKDFAHQMTLEVKAACDAINSQGEYEIMIKDAHDSARNIDHNLLPRNTKLIRGWSGSLYSMVQELDSSYDGLMYIGYHSPAGSNENPLAHTMVTFLDHIKLNGQLVSEFLIHSYIAAYLDVPVLFLSGDKGICEEAKALNENITTVAVKEGVGNSTINYHPGLALDMIEEGVKESLSKDLSKCKIELPESFELEIRYKEHKDAFRNATYPGMELIEANTIRLKTTDYMEVLRAFKFLA